MSLLFMASETIPSKDRLHPSWIRSSRRRPVRDSDSRQPSTSHGFLSPDPTPSRSNSDEMRSAGGPRTSTKRATFSSAVNRQRLLRRASFLGDRSQDVEDDIHKWFAGFRRYNQLVATDVSQQGSHGPGELAKTTKTSIENLDGNLIHDRSEAAVDLGLLWCPASELPSRNAAPPALQHTDSHFKCIDIYHALKPGSRPVHELEVEYAKFELSPGQLGNLYNPKNPNASHALGGLEGIKKSLPSDGNTELGGGSQSPCDANDFQKNEVMTADKPQFNVSHHLEHRGSGVCGPCSCKTSTTYSSALATGFCSSAHCTKSDVPYLNILASVSRGLVTPKATGGLLPFVFFAGSYAESTSDLHTDAAVPDWKARTQGALTDILVTSAFLVIPIVVLASTAFAADYFHTHKHEGRAMGALLAAAVVFVNTPASPDQGATTSDFHLRVTVGSAYVVFSTVYCRLVVLRNQWQKGYCTAIAMLAVFIALGGAAFVPAQLFWEKLTSTDPPFAVAITLPLAFVLCDVVVHIVDATNRRAGTGEGTLPPPVPGPRGAGN
jgi:hypothetical protein